MVRRLLVAVAALVVIVAVAMVVMTRAMFGSDRSRVEISEQVSRALGQPVTAGAISASPLGPALTLSDVRIGPGAAVHIDSLRVRTGPTTLLTRRLDGASVTITGLHAALPLPGRESLGQGDGPFAIARLASITLADAEISSHGRRLKINAELRPHDGHAMTVSHATIDGDDTHAQVSGEIADLATWKGALTVRGDALDGDVLRSLAWDLLDQPQAGSSTETATAAMGGTPLLVDIEVARLTLGPVPVTGVKGSAAIGPGAILLDPVSFALFGGRCQGQMALRFEGGEPSVRWRGALSNVGLAGLTSAAQGPAAITGVLNGDVDLTGTGIDFLKALTTARGSARITLSNGRIGNLAVARAIVAASSSKPQEAAANPSGSGDTAFTTLSTALTMSGGSASLIDLRLDGDDLTLLGGGGLKLDGSAITVFADVQLSRALSQQIASNRGRRLAPEAQLTVPVTIRGGTSHYQVSVELGEMTTEPLTSNGVAVTR